MSGGDAKVACQQCSENFSREDVKETYDERLEICGFICNPCCIKIAESARRCQISDCKTKPDSGPTGFRTLPSKFYDLPEGEVKRRIIKQFGIFRNVRACCNMCYVRISKSVVQTKIVYGDAVPRNSKSSTSKSSKHILQSTVEKTAQSRDDRLAEYTGPKFTRRSGSALFWDKTKIQENIVTSNAKESVVGQSNNGHTEDKNGSLNKRNQGDEMHLATSNAKTHEYANETNIARPDKLDFEKSVDKFDAKGNKMSEFSYSSTPISPTSMRFRRIQPKVSRFDEFDLSSDDLVDNIELQSPSRGRKRLRGNDDETWSPGKTKKEKIEGKGLHMKRSVSLNSNVMSDFVSCTGCRKICSIKETRPVVDEKKHVNIRLCHDCRSESKFEGFDCPIRGCTTSKDITAVVEMSIGWQTLEDETIKMLNEMGVTKNTKKCCQHCWKKIDDTIKKNEKRKGKNDTDEQIFTMCRNCCKIVPMKTTFPNIEENGRRCGVLCQICSGGQENTRNTEGKKQQKALKKLKGCEQKSIGFCTAKGCVHAGEKEPIQLVSGKKILRNYLDEKMLRAEFDLADDTDYCCRSCHARIKWFVADVKKKELGAKADSKSSLKNLTPKGRQDDEKGGNDQLAVAKEDEDSKGFENQNEYDSIVRESPSIDQQFLDGDGSNCLPVSSVAVKGLDNEPVITKTEITDDGNEKMKVSPTKDLVENEVLSVKNSSDFCTQALSSSFSTKSTIIIPPANTTAVARHPPVLQVGGQQFVLNVISRCEKECQTDQRNMEYDMKVNFNSAERGIQENIPIMPKFEGTVPANLPNAKKVKYIDAKEKTKYAVKRAGKELLDQFLQQLDDISGGCAQQLLSDIYHSKEVVMATNYEKILSSIGLLYRNTDKSNRQERLRLLSTVALHASNDTLKRFFQRNSKKRDLISVNEVEIVQAREYAKQFGPGIHVVPIGQASWKNFALAETIEPAAEDGTNENETESEEDRDTADNIDLLSSKVKGKSAGIAEEEHYVKVDGSLSPSLPVFKADDDNKLCTIGKMNRMEKKRGESGKEQLVTVKVTVRQAKEKLCNEEGAATSVAEETEGGSDLNGGKRIHRIGHENETVDNDVKVSECNHNRRQRKILVPLETTDSRTTNQTKRPKKKTLIVKSKKDGLHGDISGILQEKRKRTAFNSGKKIILEQYFEKNIYASKATVEEISNELGIDKKKIDNWFRNRRSKLKKDDEERLKRNVELKTRKGGNRTKTEKMKKNTEKPTNEIKDRTMKEGQIGTKDSGNSDNTLVETMSEGNVEKGKETRIESAAKVNEIENNNTNEGNDVELLNKQNNYIQSEDMRKNATKHLHEIKEETRDKNIDLADENNEEKIIDTEKELDVLDKSSCVKDMNDETNENDADVTDVRSSVQKYRNRSKTNELTEENSPKTNFSNLIKEGSFRVENELVEDKNLEEEPTVGRVKDIKEDVFPGLQTISTLTDVAATVQGDDGNSEIDGRKNIIDGKHNVLDGIQNVIDGKQNIIDGKQNVIDGKQNLIDGKQKAIKSVLQRDGFEAKDDNKSLIGMQLPSLPIGSMPCESLPRESSPCGVLTENAEHRNELPAKTVIPVQFVEAPNLGLLEHAESGREFSVKYGDEMVRQIHDQRLEQNENSIEKPWSSIAQGSNISLGVIHEYENENAESNVRDDLALALNSDPEFMKDFSELMNITKSY